MSVRSEPATASDCVLHEWAIGDCLAMEGLLLGLDASHERAELTDKAVCLLGQGHYVCCMLRNCCHGYFLSASFEWVGS